MPFVSSLPYATDIRVTPRIEGTFNGSRFALKGSATPFAERRETTLDVDLHALELAPYVAYLPSRPTLDVAGGTLTTRLTIAFVEHGPTDRRLEFRGTAHVDGLAIKRRDGTPLVSAGRIAIVLDRIGMFDRQARIASVAIQAPSVDVVRLSDGTLEVAGPMLERRATPDGLLRRRQPRPPQPRSGRGPFPSERSRSIMEPSRSPTRLPVYARRSST